MPDFRDKAEFPGCKVVDISDLAIKVDFGERCLWIPKSQVDDDSEIWEHCQEGTLVVSEWIAKEKGLI